MVGALRVKLDFSHTGTNHCYTCCLILLFLIITACEVNYKAHPKDKTMYLARLPDDEWQAVDCPPNLALGLVWRQDLCLCGEELIPQDPNDPCGLSGYNPDPNNRHKYIRVSRTSALCGGFRAQLDWLQSLNQFFINMPYHILVSSLTRMALL